MPWGRGFGRGWGMGATLGYCPWTGMPRGWRWMTPYYGYGHPYQYIGRYRPYGYPYYSYPYYSNPWWW